MTLATVAALELWIRTHPWPALAPPSQSLRVLDRHGALLRESVNDEGERSRWVPLVEVSPALIEATLAAEDNRFRDHNGIDAVLAACLK